MFFVKKLRHDILLDPSCLGPNMVKLIRDRIFAELEGTCLGKYGYVIMIYDLKEEDIAPGLVDCDTGAVNVIIWYTAILFRPFINEVLDAVVSVASDSTGFFCRVGPMTIFVSQHAMSEDLCFDSANGEGWISNSTDESVDGGLGGLDLAIREGCVVRLRLMGLTVEAGCISAIGTIKDDYLGLLETF